MLQDMGKRAPQEKEKEEKKKKAVGCVAPMWFVAWCLLHRSGEEGKVV